jgi:molybdopterin-containing oxidoreductase family iron-sulfur binding subunit
MGMTRREAVRALALTGAGVGATVASVVVDRHTADAGDSTGDATKRTLDVLDGIPPQEGEDLLLHMQRDLKRAMAKSVEQRHWIMVIDVRKCVGCHACTIGCVAENKLPPGVVYRPVTTQERGEFPNVHLQFTPRPCMQCANPSCVPVCPVKATWKRPDGVVVVDYDKCIGCRYCLTACPYGARTSDFGEFYTDRVAAGAPGGAEGPVAGPNMAYERQPNHEYAKHWQRQGHHSPIGNARKCHFCLHRLDKGLLPACVTTCIGRATYFGDRNDPDSLVVKLTAKNNYETLLSHKETKPQVFYLT